MAKLGEGKKTDNKYVEGKLALRRLALKDPAAQGRKLRVLDCFSGDGVMWGTLAKERDMEVTRIEAKDDAKGIYLRGNNLKFMRGMDMSQFDVIDLDAYGSPMEQMRIVLASDFGGWVFVTYIASAMRYGHKDLMRAIGIDDVIMEKCQSLTRHYSDVGMFEWLRRKGVEKLHLFAPDANYSQGFKRMYFGFRK